MNYLNFYLNNSLNSLIIMLKQLKYLLYIILSIGTFSFFFWILLIFYYGKHRGKLEVYKESQKNITKDLINARIKGNRVFFKPTLKTNDE